MYDYNKVMKITRLLSFLPLLIIASCSKSTTSESALREKYGVFLGAKSGNISRFYQYDNVCVDIEKFTTKEIKNIKDNNTKIYAYLSIGSLENYRPYYDEFKQDTFMDYENWPNERWIDVSKTSWQDHLIEEATKFKNLGADGLFMDNFDVYYIALEEYDCAKSFKEGIYQGCKSILNRLSALNLSLMINSGTDFLERLNEEQDSLLDKIDVYAQETVFSSIIDYDKDIFGKQNKEEQDYLFNVISFMKKKANILLIEYTKDDSLIKEIASYCSKNNFYYYISSKVNLD